MNTILLIAVIVLVGIAGAMAGQLIAMLVNDWRQSDYQDTMREDV